MMQVSAMLMVYKRGNNRVWDQSYYFHPKTNVSGIIINVNSTMKIFNYSTISLLALLAASCIISTNAQDDPDEIILGILKNFLQKSEYVHKVMFELLGYKMVSGSVPIPEPMRFDNFTFDHYLIFTDGISHTYNPLLHGFSQSVFTIYPIVDEDYGVRIHLFIPVANLTGTYDLDVRQFTYWGGPYLHHTGNGAYEHVFHDVHLWIDLTVDTTVDGSRVVASDVHSRLEFSRCELWAENYETDGVPWTDAKWISQSAAYKVRYHEMEHETDILLSQTVSSYLAMFWGVLHADKDSAYQGLIQSGEQPVTRKPLSVF